MGMNEAFIKHYDQNYAPPFMCFSCLLFLCLFVDVCWILLVILGTVRNRENSELIFLCAVFRKMWFIIVIIVDKRQRKLRCYGLSFGRLKVHFWELCKNFWTHGCLLLKRNIFLRVQIQPGNAQTSSFSRTNPKPKIRQQQPSPITISTTKLHITSKSLQYSLQ